MHILWINEKSSFFGGAETYVYQTASLIKNHYNIDSTLLYSQESKSDPKYLQIFKNSYPIQDLEKQLLQIPHDVVYVQNIFDDVTFQILAKAKAPVVRFFHDHWLFCLRRHKLHYFTNEPCFECPGTKCYPLHFAVNRDNNWFGFKVDTLSGLKYTQELNQKLDAFVVGSNFMAKEVEDNGFERQKISVIPLYAKVPDADLKPVARDKNLLLFVGGLLRGKGVDILLHALTRTKKTYRLVLIGDGRQKDTYVELTKKLKLESRVEFLGKLKPDEVTDWYQKANCIVLPVRWPEPFGLVGPEAMRFGTPVIASYIGGITDWLKPEKNGLAVPYNDPQDLAAAIDRLTDDNELWSVLSRGALQSYNDHYKPEYHFNKLLSLFNQLIDDKKLKEKLAWSKLTIYGSEKVETLLNNLFQEIKETVEGDSVLNTQCRVLVSIGGYGKSEGGVLIENGVETPHNNLDLVLISKSQNTDEIKSRLNEKLKPASDKYNIEIDTSVVSERKLSQSPHFLVWYEMTKGHKFITGDNTFIDSLKMNDLNKVPVGDFQDLIVNRGSLLIINQWLLKRRALLTDGDKKILIKHVMKAVIGFGDGYLYFSGRYHWSYREKQKLIRQCKELPSEFLDLYNTAAEFRFKPDYKPYLQMNLQEWMQQLMPIFRRVFYKSESLRLGIPLDNKNLYLQSAIQVAFQENFWSLRSVRNKVKGFIEPPAVSFGNTQFYLLSPQQRLGILFPLVAFDLENNLSELAIYFRTEENAEAIRDSYVKLWGKYFDKNFFNSLKYWDKKGAQTYVSSN
jgi:glycosyltransferase involved in cell wall biosynthesis